MHFPKAIIPIETAEGGIIAFIDEKHWQNDPWPIEVTVDGMSMSFYKWKLSKTESSYLVKCFGIDTVRNKTQ